MATTRQDRAKINSMVSFGCQIITLICGLVVPRLMLGAFGSEIYGATSSITQFLSYIALLEGGIGGVARAALYKPLAENDDEAISAVVAEIKRFFRVIAYIFAGYVLIIACSFKFISDVKGLDWVSTFALVTVISISTFGQYFIGISYSVLLQAGQKQYITNLVSIAATVLNTLAIFILVNLGCNIIVVKLVSSCIFVLRPIALWFYVRRHFNLKKTKKSGKTYLTQKWSGLGQHIAFFLHSNTDVAVLTVFSTLASVAVYSIYNMVISNIQNITASFIAGMEAVFGDMLAKKEYKELHSTFSLYETIISVISIILFSTTAVLIVPFVKLYTAGINDADYIAPVFAILLIMSSLLYCLRMPYHSLTVAAGHFKETKAAAYGEALINIAVSIILVIKLGLVGVAIGTIIATAFRFVYYVYYLSKNIFGRSIGLFIKRFSVNAFSFAVIVLSGNSVIKNIEISDYMDWAICGFIMVAFASAVVFALNAVVYRSDLSGVIKKLVKR